MASRELPIIPPKPVFHSMPAAVAAAISSGNSLSDIRLDKWAETYRCDAEAIRQVWDAELGRRSREPSNQYEAPEGK